MPNILGARRPVASLVTKDMRSIRVDSMPCREPTHLSSNDFTWPKVGRWVGGFLSSTDHGHLAIPGPRALRDQRQGGHIPGVAPGLGALGADHVHAHLPRKSGP